MFIKWILLDSKVLPDFPAACIHSILKTGCTY